LMLGLALTLGALSVSISNPLNSASVSGEAFLVRPKRDIPSHASRQLGRTGHAYGICPVCPASRIPSGTFPPDMPDILFGQMSRPNVCGGLAGVSRITVFGAGTEHLCCRCSLAGFLPLSQQLAPLFASPCESGAFWLSSPYQLQRLASFVVLCG
jgi:hypothetical protein